MSAVPPDAVTPLPGAAAAAVAWRSQSQLYLTVIAKATFAFAPDAVMTRVAPQEIFRAEVHHGKNPARSVRFTVDVAPYLGLADVLFTGDAHAPSGSRVKSLPVRLAVFAANRCSLDKRLLVRDRDAFERMPIVYERAVAGIDQQDNPLGVASTAGQVNIVDLDNPMRPAGFGPIARAWPSRKRLLGSTPRKVLDGPIAEIPDGFEWSYFQAAPLDQRIPFLQGDEWIVLEGLHQATPRLQTRLPRARGVARIHGLPGYAAAPGEVLELHADTLRIDGAEQRCTVVWRRFIPISGEDALSTVQIVAGVAVEGEAIVWPDVTSGRRGRTAPAPALAPERGPAGTMRIEDASGPPALTWIDAGAASATLAISHEEVEIIELSPPDAPSPLTIAISPEDDEVARAPALPFQQAREPLVHSALESASSATLALSIDDDAHAADQPAIPFPLEPSPEPRRASNLPIPGAPWSAGNAPPLPPFSPAVAPVSTTETPALEPPQPFLFPEARPQDDAIEHASPAEVPATAASRFFHVLARGEEEDDELSPASLQPLGDDDEVTVERCAIIEADLAERRVPRAEVLAAHGLSESRWSDAEARWRAAREQEAKLGERALRDRFDAASIAAWEKLRGPLEITDYARLMVATERKRIASALDALAIRRTVWARMKRLWAKRIARDPRFAGRIEAELAKQRETPRQRA